MTIILAGYAGKLLDAWTEFFGAEENVKIVEGDMTKMKCDAMVSPANSFGFMDGGLDYALSERFGWDLEKKLQKQIKELPEGEGLCTGVGRMQPLTAARQMFQAYSEIILGQRMDFSTFGEAQKYHWNINPQGMIWTH